MVLRVNVKTGREALLQDRSFVALWNRFIPDYFQDGANTLENLKAGEGRVFRGHEYFYKVAN